MLTTKRITVAGVVVAVACVLGSLPGSGDDKPKVPQEVDQLSGVMKEKLRFTHQLLTSLAREDFPVLENSAQELRRIAREEWGSDPTPEYRAQLQVFWTTLEGIETGAQRRDVEEAALAYMQMTLACVKCHKVIRRQQEQ